MADDGKGLPRRHAEGHVAQHPIFLGRFAADFVAEPNIAEFDRAPWIVHAYRFTGSLDRHRLIEQLEYPFASSHRRLQNIEFFAEVLNWPEEPLRVHRECGKHTERQAATQNANPACPKNKSDR